MTDDTLVHLGHHRLMTCLAAQVGMTNRSQLLLYQLVTILLSSLMTNRFVMPSTREGSKGVIWIPISDKNLAKIPIPIRKFSQIPIPV